MILVDCTLSDLRVFGIAIVGPSHKRERRIRTIVYKAQGRDGVESRSTSIEGNKGKEEKNFREDPDGLGSQ